MTAYNDKRRPKGDIIYLGITGICFLALFIVFLFFPRPVYSELEKRDLDEFPNFEDHKENLSGYTSGISNWFSNTQPFRDHFLTLSMKLRNSLKLKIRDDNETISFIATSDGMNDAPTGSDDTGTIEEIPRNLAEENAKVANAGIVVLGNAPNVRAMMAYGGTANSGGTFISTVNEYAKTFPSVNVYVAIASSPGEFYMPDKVSKHHKSEVPTLNNIKEKISSSVKFVNVHDVLRDHSKEDIFLRTDHHWAPLGAFYAAKEFAKVANVPFKNLDSYEKHVIHGYVGSMYGYSKDISVKNSPEDFVYYTPKGLDYKTTFITYKVNSDYQVTGASAPYQSQFFKTFKDGSGLAYQTFMGGDQSLVHVTTGTPSNRRLLIIKDSFGNAMPGYLFYSFADIHVIDFRYFNKNMKKYIEENGITDIAFVFNIFNVCNPSTFNKVNRFLSQRDGEIAKDTPKKVEPEKESEEKNLNDKEENNSAQDSQSETIKPSSDIKEEPKAVEETKEKEEE